MSHVRKPIAGVLILKTSTCMVEALTGLSGSSPNWVMNGLHKTSDEMALPFLCFACILSTSLSRILPWLANTLNSIGLLFISSLMTWEPSTDSFFRWLLEE
jgi:Co/Zn/Cd efflux system component